MINDRVTVHLLHQNMPPFTEAFVVYRRESRWLSRVQSTGFRTQDATARLLPDAHRDSNDFLIETWANVWEYFVTLRQIERRNLENMFFVVFFTTVFRDVLTFILNVGICNHQIDITVNK